jgi:hypothetical protein
MSNDIGVRDHLTGTEKRKLDEGSSSNVMTKNQRTDNHHMILEGLDHGPFKNEEIKPEERDLKDEQPQQNFGGQRGLLVEALMDKGPNQTGFLGVTSPSSAVSRSSLDTTALKQQLDAIKNDATLKNDQKSAKIAEIFNQHPHLQRMLMATKLKHDNKMLGQSVRQETLLQRDPMPGSQMVQKEYGSGFPSNGSPFIGNSHAQALGGSASTTPRSGTQMLGPHQQLAPRGPGLSFIGQQAQQQQQTQDVSYQQFNFGNFQQQQPSGFQQQGIGIPSYINEEEGQKMWLANNPEEHQQHQPRFPNQMDQNNSMQQQDVQMAIPFEQWLFQQQLGSIA